VASLACEICAADLSCQIYYVGPHVHSDGLSHGFGLCGEPMAKVCHRINWVVHHGLDGAGMWLLGRVVLVVLVVVVVAVLVVAVRARTQPAPQ
jgi:hypothetical protein